MIEQAAMKHWADWIVEHDVEELNIGEDKSGKIKVTIVFKDGTRLPKPDSTHYGRDWDLRFT